ncbi:hypothetical protein NFI96_008463 [Prochilodus magdalenae]|nr:hypothetical protein NFI96_008463 [Prochilodus magdalenae]
MAFYTRCLQDLPKVTISDVQHIIQASSTAPRSKREKGFKMYVSSYIDNYEGVTEHVGVAKDHSVKEVAESAGVWKRAVIRVYQQWENPSPQGTLLGTVPEKASTKSAQVHECLNTDVAYIQKLVQSMPNPVPADFSVRHLYALLTTSLHTEDSHANACQATTSQAPACHLCPFLRKQLVIASALSSTGCNIMSRLVQKWLISCRV